MVRVLEMQKQLAV